MTRQSRHPGTAAAPDPARSDHRGTALEVFTLTASGQAIRQALREMHAFLRRAGLDADECGTAEIVLAEVMNNIAEHAYAGQGVGDIRVTLTIDRRNLTARIVDRGAALPDLRPPRGQLPGMGSAIPALPEGGFGWFLIRALTSDLRYERREGENHLHLCLNLKAPARVCPDR
ncbi:ATP-binding protein [Pelagivirga sediminicola]|uniref:ATP-binding protein n=1 Tax=Pelagivirga sediminicola TaxID=2170575 RepID=A0A2T7G5W5_9RHOB|nr:ATP-binding protein [Pelagivirga sediminicola]PVA09767.1 ATP-binding protein [Pelagivirga sediminicola]